VTIEPKRLRVVDKVTKATLLDGELYAKIKASDSSWTLDEGTQLIFTLEKAEENIWKTILVGDTEIDTTKVDNSKKLDEFDTETQGALRKIMYEQNRKNQGLPTTDEEQQIEAMKKAWNAPGSPFAGTPFDPSKINFPGNQQFGIPPQ